MTTSATDPVWTSANGVALADLVPARLRAEWTARGLCPGRDVYTLFHERARDVPDRDAVVDDAGALSYAELDARVRRAAAALAAAGHGAADIIGVLLPNGRDAVVAELAVAAIGAVALPIPHTRGPRDVARLLERSRAAALVTVHGMVDAVDLPARTRVWTPHRRTPGAAPPHGGARSLDDATAEDVRAWRPARPDAEAPARLLVSSGSESEPKMVAYSHNAMAGGRANYVAALRRGADPMRALLLVSLASSYGSLGTSVILARLGGTLVLLPRFDAAAALRAAELHRPTHLFGVPTMLWRMTESGTVADTSSLRAVVSSAGPVHGHVVEACERRFGMTPVNVYGSSDGVNCHTGRVPGRWEPGLAGVPDPDVAEIGIRDPQGRPLPPGEPGEIWARGPMTPLCYVAAPELDARHRAPGGWVRSGDLGRLDPDGTLWVLDRLKRVVIRGGVGLSPADVERELSAHPGVADVHCVPVRDRDLGERMCACVAPRRGAPPPSPADMLDHLRRRGLDKRRLPERFLVLPELPLGPTGKVCATTLARLAADASADAGGGR
ncbi:class I adenylate-forming enzyme family protein [Actinomadura algeriensis]|uniref:Acyl-CoA synthetase (AMP-forming)/AMP-acid ligase II n=1 Tax=Actinomadura algeriensis TaxID=1679523 RepID=A0ABR9JR10_9ACTN|nr:class I adenylate-forming enzyme family protein [Actinomadura algeriensis]MBE1532831.1 acyl-CoA synthetase (AMP-forming)/AMP-acid ligase II [Actinomadura algeriensis]